MAVPLALKNFSAERQFILMKRLSIRLNPYVIIMDILQEECIAGLATMRSLSQASFQRP